MTASIQSPLTLPNGSVLKNRLAKAAMEENDYKQQLTALLLELARTQAEIDK